MARSLAPLAGDGALGLLDNAAVFTPPSGRELVISADAIVQGVHFLPEDPPGTTVARIAFGRRGTAQFVPYPLANQHATRTVYSGFDT